MHATERLSITNNQHQGCSCNGCLISSYKYPINLSLDARMLLALSDNEIVK